MSLPRAHEILCKHGIAFVVSTDGRFTSNCPECGGRNNFVHHDDDVVEWHCHDCGKGKIVPLRPASAAAAAGDGHAEASRNSVAPKAAAGNTDGGGTPRNGEHRTRWTLPPMVYRDGATIPQRKFLYGYAYARGFVSAIIGDGGVGKSIDLIAECLALASGKNLLGTIPRERVRVGYWNGDDPYVELE